MPKFKSVSDDTPATDTPAPYIEKKEKVLVPDAPPIQLSTGVYQDTPSVKIDANAVGYILMKDFTSANMKGQVIGEKAGKILAVPRDLIAIQRLLDSGADLRVLRHVETCPHCNKSHACTLETRADIVARAT